MKEYLNDVRMVGQGDGARNHLNKKKSEALEHGGACNIQGVFFNWASPEFAKCWPVSNQFKKKMLES